MHPIFKADFVAVGLDLPNAGEARFHGKAPALPDLVFFDFGGDRGSGTGSRVGARWENYPK